MNSQGTFPQVEVPFRIGLWQASDNGATSFVWCVAVLVQRARLRRGSLRELTDCHFAMSIDSKSSGRCQAAALLHTARILIPSSLFRVAWNMSRITDQMLLNFCSGALSCVSGTCCCFLCMRDENISWCCFTVIIRTIRHCFVEKALRYDIYKCEKKSQQLKQFTLPVATRIQPKAMCAVDCRGNPSGSHPEQIIPEEEKSARVCTMSPSIA